MERQSSSRAGLLNGSSSISSTTTIVRAALIGKQKKFTHPQMSCFSTKKSKKRSTRLQMSCFVPKISVKQCRSEKF